MAIEQTTPSANIATSKDWLESVKNMTISSFVDTNDFILLVEGDKEFTKADFERDLKKVSRKIKK